MNDAVSPVRDIILVENAVRPLIQRPVGTIFLKKSQKKSKYTPRKGGILPKLTSSQDCLIDISDHFNVT